MLTVPAQIFWAPTRARLIAAARFMPGVWAVFTSRELAGITRTPWVFQSTGCGSLIFASLPCPSAGDRLCLARRGAVELAHGLGVEGEPGPFREIGKLGEAGGTRDGRGDARPGDEPGQRHLRRRDAEAAGDAIEGAQDPQAPLVQIFLPDAAPTRTLAQILFTAVLAGQEAGGERVIGNDADLLLDAERLQLRLETLAVVEIVERLQALEARQVLPLTHLQGLSETGRAMVGSADRPYLAFPDEAIIGLQRLLEVSLGIVDMGLVEIDVVGLEPLQGGLDGFGDLRLGQALAPIGPLPAAFGRDDDALAPAAALQPIAQDDLGFASLM